jgi:lysophospholipase L1-like esterase
VAALGDSITDAKSGGGSYLKALREACPKSMFLNFGKGGDMVNQMRRRFEREILPQIKSQDIDTLLVYGGVNDLYSDLTAGRTNDRIESDLSAIYQQAKQAGLTVVAVTVSPWGGFSKYWNPRRGENTRLLNSWILGQVARGPVDRAVDSFAPLSCGNRDVLCPEYETPSHDGLHPGQNGHTILGEKLAKEAFADCL